MVEACWIPGDTKSASERKIFLFDRILIQFCFLCVIEK